MEKDLLLIQYTLRVQYPSALQPHEIIGEDIQGIASWGRKGRLYKLEAWGSDNKAQTEGNRVQN